MTENGIERLLGGLDARVKAIQDDLHEMKDEHHDRLNRHSDRITVLETESKVRKAGARWLAGLLAASAAMGATLAELARVALMAMRGH